MAGEADDTQTEAAPVGGAFSLDQLLDQIERDGPPDDSDDQPDRTAELPKDEDDDDALNDKGDDEEKTGEEEDEEEEGEEGEEDDDEEEASEDEEDILTSVSEAELKRIQADPALKKLHRLMQRDYTGKATVVAERERAVVAREQAFTDLETELSTAQGFVGYLSQHMASRPDIVGAAFEAVAQGEGGHDFLVSIGRQKPELLERAWERVQELVEDEDERKRYDRDVESMVREQRLKSREDRVLRETFARELGALEEAALKEARKLEIPKDDQAEVVAKLRAALKNNINSDGTLKLDKEAARKVARDVKAELARVEARVRSRLEREVTTESQRKVKEKAAKAGKSGRVPPRNVVSGGRKEAPDNGQFKPPLGRDPLDAFLHHRVAGK